jgi:hypothetical protein
MALCGSNLSWSNVAYSCWQRECVTNWRTSLLRAMSCMWDNDEDNFRSYPTVAIDFRITSFGKESTREGKSYSCIPIHRFPIHTRFMQQLVTQLGLCRWFFFHRFCCGFFLRFCCGWRPMNKINRLRGVTTYVRRSVDNWTVEQY